MSRLKRRLALVTKWRKPWFLALGVAAMWLAFSGIAQAQTNKYALLIGINQYTGSGFISLTGCLNDISLMRRILESPKFGFAADNIVLLTDGKATHAGIKKAMQDLYAKVSPGDIVYIHYAGHGSYTCDITGVDPTGIDQTLVGFGSRSDMEPTNPSVADCSAVRERGAKAMPEREGALDNYDVLDKELNIWLSKLGEKTENVVFVSDSCHSGTITRGTQALPTRGVGPDMRPYPLAIEKLVSERTGKPNWIAVSAARAEESAKEYRSPTGDHHGAFTWFWAESLSQAGPRDTWGDVFRRASTQMEAARIPAQHPQLEGNPDRLVFGGQIQPRPRTFTVTAVSDDGATATINAGGLLRVSGGSVFRKFDAQPQNAAQLPTMTVIEATALDCKATVSGKVQPGDAVVLERWQPAFVPQKVYLRADLDQDKPVVARLEAMVRDMPAFALTASQADSDIVLWVVRPEKDAEGHPIFAKPGDSLPVSAPDASPEIWVLDPGEHLYDGQENLKAATTEAGLKVLRDNLERLARLRGILGLTPPPGQPTPLDVTFNLYAPIPLNSAAARDCSDVVMADRRLWKLESRVKAEDLSRLNVSRGERLLMVSVTNRSAKDYYLYGLNITLKGQILPFLPPAQYAGDSKVAAGQTRDFCNYTLILIEPTEYVRILATERPIDVSVVTQKEYAALQTRGGKGLDPLESMLANRAGLTRGALPAKPLEASEWTTLQTAVVQK